MFCWSCGKLLSGDIDRCGSCGAEAAFGESSRGSGRVSPLRLSTCPACGYVGEGMLYFRRSSHAALLVGVTVLTYGIGGLVYWLVKRNACVCPSCGLSWDRARRFDTPLVLDRPHPSPTSSQRGAAVRPEALPRGGLFRRTAGVALAILAAYLLGVGFVGAGIEAIVASLGIGLVAAWMFAWGWRALQRRREGLLQSLQTQVLHVAEARAGRVTATDVAADCGVTLAAAERVLFSLDDGFRVCSVVTDEGLLIFDFPEIRARGLPASATRDLGEEPTELWETI